MRILMRDGVEFQGTAVQIVRAMQGTAFGLEDLTVPQYVAWVTANARGLEKVDLAVGGATDGEIAASLIDEMIRTGLSRLL